MIRCAPLLLLLIAFGCAPTPDTVSSEQQSADIEALKIAKVQTWRQLYRDQDAEGLEHFLLDGFRVIGADGSISTKAEEVAWLANHPWSGAADFEYIVENIVFQGPDVAIVYGHGRGTRMINGQPECIETYRSSNLFRRSEGRWRPAFSHLSGAECLSREAFAQRYGDTSQPR